MRCNKKYYSCYNLYNSKMKWKFDINRSKSILACLYSKVLFPQ